MNLNDNLICNNNMTKTTIITTTNINTSIITRNNNKKKKKNKKKEEEKEEIEREIEIEREESKNRKEYQDDEEIQEEEEKKKRKLNEIIIESERENENENEGGNNLNNNNLSNHNNNNHIVINVDNDKNKKKLRIVTKKSYDSKINKLKEWLKNHKNNKIQEYYNSMNNTIILPLPSEVIIEFFNEISFKENSNHNNITNVYDYNNHFQNKTNSLRSSNTLAGYRSALVALYKSHGILNEFPSDLLTNFMLNRRFSNSNNSSNSNDNKNSQSNNNGDSHNNNNNNNNNNNTSDKKSSGEGKNHITFEAYQSLALISLKEGYDQSQYLSVTTFLLLCWNLMSRSNTIANLTYNCITWSDQDSLVITIQRQKSSSSEGINSYYLSHVYANPEMPEICPLLHLGLKIVSSAKIDPNNNKLFSNPNPDSNFGKWLYSHLYSLSLFEELEIDGFPREIGTYSIGKGAVTYALSVENGPSVMAIHERAGLTSVTTTYQNDENSLNIGHAHAHTQTQMNLQTQTQSQSQMQTQTRIQLQGQDEMIGRLVCGLSFTKDEFATLPPHFIDINSVTESDWEYMVSGYKNYPVCFQNAIPYLVANVIYHRKWIRTHLPREHPFFVSRFHTLKLGEKFQHLIVTGNKYCPYTGISATGIPPSMNIQGTLNDVEILQKVQSILEENGKNQSNLTNTINTINTILQNNTDQHLDSSTTTTTTTTTSTPTIPTTNTQVGSTFLSIISPPSTSLIPIILQSPSSIVTLNKDNIELINDNDNDNSSNNNSNLDQLNSNYNNNNNDNNSNNNNNNVIDVDNNSNNNNNVNNRVNENNHDISNSNEQLLTMDLVQSNLLNSKTIELRSSIRINHILPKPLDDVFVHFWGGRYHCIPEDYIVPTVNCKGLWDLWFWGNKELNIKAIHHVDPRVDFKTRKERGKFSKAKIVIQKIIEKTGLSHKEITRLSMIETDKAFEKGFKEAIAYNENSKRRYSELIFTTIYSILMEIEKTQTSSYLREAIEISER